MPAGEWLRQQDEVSKASVDCSGFQQLRSHADLQGERRHRTWSLSHGLHWISRDMAFMVDFENAHFLGKHHSGPLGSETVVLPALISRFLSEMAVIWETAQAT